MRKLLLASLVAIGVLGLMSQAQACGDDVQYFPGTRNHAIGCVTMPSEGFNNTVAVYKEGRCSTHQGKLRCRWGRGTHFSDGPSPVTQIGNFLGGVGNLLGGIGMLNMSTHGAASTNISNTAVSSSFSSARAISRSSVRIGGHHR